MQSLMTRLLLGGGGGFSPSALFASGEQGAWYDPSDLTTLFQDSAGTTPVTAVEQPVGLVLDKSKGLVLGSELITNGDFSQGSTSWSLGTGWSVSNGQATHVAGAASYINNTGSSVVVGKCYKVTLDIISNDGTVYVFLPAGGANVAFSGTGTKTAYIFPTTSVGTIGVYCLAGTNATVDNVSVRELPGNHAYQTTSTSRPTLRARYNLLTYSEQFDNAAWIKGNVTVSANSTTAPDGTITADTLIENTANNNHELGLTPVAIPGGVTVVSSIYVKRASGTRNFRLTMYSGADGVRANYDLTALTATNGSYGASTFVSASIQDVGNNWYRLILVGSVPGASPFFNPALLNGTTSFYTGDGTSGVFLWGAQLIQTAVFPSNTYQQITTATSYATGAAFPPYLFFDGVDDSLLTNSVDFSATDKMTVWAGVTKNSDAATGMLAELSAVASSNNGSFALYNVSGSGNYSSILQGTLTYTSTYTTFTAPITNVASLAYNIAGATGADEVSAKFNGVTTAPSSTSGTSAGTGNFGNYPLFIGRRNNATLPLNGNIYSLIIRGAQSTSDQIISTEQWVAQKSGITIP